MKIFKKIFLNHKGAILLAVLLSVIVVLPQVYFRFDQTEIHQGIELIPDSPWSPRIREIQDGNGFGSIYYKDGKSDPYLFQPLGSAVVGYVGKLFNLDINNTLLLSRILFPFISFLLIYGFVYFISRDKPVALAGASIILLTESIQHISGIRSVLSGISPRSFIDLARPAHPAFIFIPFFAFLWSFWIFYKKQIWWWGLASIIFLGINFYNYFYTWTYLYAFGGVLGILLLFRKEWTDFLKITYIFVGGVLISLPYWWNVYQASLYSSYADVSMRFGIVSSRELLFIGFIPLLALLIFLILFPKEDKKRYVFGLALLFAPFITMNQQLITGKVLQAGHYHWYFHKPVAIIFVLITLFYWLRYYEWRMIRKVLAATIIIISFSVGFFVQTYSYAHDNRIGQDGGSILAERQKYGPVMRWLSKYAEKEAVVFANEEASHITVIYTPLNVFYHRVAFASLSATKERLLETLFTFYRLKGVGKEDVRDTFFRERDFLSWNIYGIYYRELLGSYEAIPDEKVEEIIARFEEILNVPTPAWLEEVWRRYEVEYIIWDTKVDSEWQLKQYPFLKEIATFGDLKLYQLHTIKKELSR